MDTDIMFKSIAATSTALIRKPMKWLPIATDLQSLVQ